jgi:hypothetical protein
MISAQTWFRVAARETRSPPIGAWREGVLFRIMLYPAATIGATLTASLP